MPHVVHHDAWSPFPILTAYRSDSEGSRIERLSAVCEELERAKISTVLRLHDHKGVLSVWWSETPSERLKTVLNEAWSSHNEDSVEHRTADGHLIGTSPGFNQTADRLLPVASFDEYIERRSKAASI